MKFYLKVNKNGYVRFGISSSKSDQKKRFYIFRYSSTQMRDTLKWSEAKMKEIKLSFQWQLQFYDQTLLAPHREQKLQLGPIYPTLSYTINNIRYSSLIILY